MVYRDGADVLSDSPVEMKKGVRLQGRPTDRWKADMNETAKQPRKLFRPTLDGSNRGLPRAP
jgi:hypothetical protein